VVGEKSEEKRGVKKKKGVGTPGGKRLVARGKRGEFNKRSLLEEKRREESLQGRAKRKRIRQELTRESKSILEDNRLLDPHWKPLDRK